MDAKHIRVELSDLKLTRDCAFCFRTLQLFCEELAYYYYYPSSWLMLACGSVTRRCLLTKASVRGIITWTWDLPLSSMAFPSVPPSLEGRGGAQTHRCLRFGPNAHHANAQGGEGSCSDPSGPTFHMLASNPWTNSGSPSLFDRATSHDSRYSKRCPFRKRKSIFRLQQSGRVLCGLVLNAR